MKSKNHYLDNYRLDTDLVIVGGVSCSSGEVVSIGAARWSAVGGWSAAGAGAMADLFDALAPATNADASDPIAQVKVYTSGAN